MDFRSVEDFRSEDVRTDTEISDDIKCWVWLMEGRQRLYETRVAGVLTVAGELLRVTDRASWRLVGVGSDWVRLVSRRK